MSPTLAQVTLDLLALGDMAEFNQRISNEMLTMEWRGWLNGESFGYTHAVNWPMVHAAEDLDTYLAREAYKLWQKVRDSPEFKATQPSRMGEQVR